MALEPAGPPLVVHFDGQPGVFCPVAGAGAVAYLDSLEVASASERLPETTEWGTRLTSNEAEYWALILAVQVARRLSAPRAVFRGDSKLVVMQMSGRWGFRKRRLERLACRALLVMGGMPAVFEWVSRDHERQQRADELSRLGTEESPELEELRSR